MSSTPRRGSTVGPLITTLVGVCLLLSLGTWQIYRLRWKENLIKTFDHHLSQPPQDIKTFLPLFFIQPKEIEFMPVRVVGEFLKGFSLKLQGRTFEGRVGYHLIMALKQPDGSLILIDRGWMPLAEVYDPPQSFSGPQSSHSLTLNGYIRLKSDQNFMTPQNQYEHSEIYTLDPVEIAKKFHLRQAYPFYVVETGVSAKSFFPSPAKKVLHLRNFHLQYAITWYALALMLIIIYMIFRRQRL